ncbi:MAG: hypothetical protein SPD80_05825 [Atopobium sp.]|uniref:hypothetical protein n=1 Tax=Atopobium sp. TaxID=1872650 RepID=UPI002A824B67|nr:hypothetical protein [Atopobium sp.]MDY4523088.1 hypothetical protein [Atopobium sp.]
MTTDLTNKIDHLRVFISKLKPYKIKRKLEELSNLSKQYIPLPKDKNGVVFTGDEKFFVDHSGHVRVFGVLKFRNGEWWLHDDEMCGNHPGRCAHIQDEWAALYLSINGNTPNADKLKAFVMRCKQLAANEGEIE